MNIHLCIAYAQSAAIGHIFSIMHALLTLQILEEDAVIIYLFSKVLKRKMYILRLATRALNFPSNSAICWTKEI